MPHTAPDSSNQSRQSFLRFALRLREHIRLGDRQVIYVWAAIVGVIGAATALLFEFFVDWVQNILTGKHHYSQIKAFTDLALENPWWCALVPAIGGLLAGLTLLFTHRFVPAKATEYMEAVALGNGYVPTKPSLLRTVSAIFTIGSGGSIGREGPLVQSAAVAASWIGRFFRMSAPRLRLMVACAAASGMSAAFHTPLAGGLFVSEIVLGAMTIDFLAPLLVSSCAGYFMMSLFQEPTPIYQVGAVSLIGNSHIFWCALLAVISSFVAAGWMWLLKFSRSHLNGKRIWLPIRLAAAGLLVGVIATQYPEIVGNGRNMINSLIHFEFTYPTAILLLALKIATVAIMFGTGTVGGVLTPSLTIGSILGFLFSGILLYFDVPGEYALAYTLIGMAAFFTTAANAPITSLVLVIEFTMAGQLMFPLIIAVLVSHGVAKLMKVKSMYYDSLIFGPRSTFEKPLGQVQLKDVARTTPTILRPQDTFGTIASTFITNPTPVLFVASKKGKYLGSILAQDVVAFAKSKELADTVLAIDVLRTDMTALPSNMHLPEALGAFSKKNAGESMALVNPDTKEITGVVNKADLYLVLSEIMRREKIQ